MWDSEEGLKFRMNSVGTKQWDISNFIDRAENLAPLQNRKSILGTKSLRNRRIPPAQASNRRRGAHRCPSSARRRMRAPSRSMRLIPSRPPLQQQRTDSTDHKHHPVAGASNSSRHIYKQNKRGNIQIGRRGEARHPKRSGGRRRRGRSRRAGARRRRSRRSRPSRRRNSDPALASPHLA